MSNAEEFYLDALGKKMEAQSECTNEAIIEEQKSRRY